MSGHHVGADKRPLPARAPTLNMSTQSQCAALTLHHCSCAAVSVTVSPLAVRNLGKPSGSWSVDGS